MTFTPCAPINKRAVDTFWAASRKFVGDTSIEAVVGPSVINSLLPPAVQLDDDRGRATHLAEQYLEEDRTEFRTPKLVIEEEDAPLSAPGDLLIVCDGDGIPRVLVMTSAVEETATEVIETHYRVWPRPSKKPAAWRSPRA